MAADLVAHAGPAVRDGQQHVLAGRALAVLADVLLVELDDRGLDRQPAAARHRVARVGGEVEHDALELRAVGLDHRRAGRERDGDADVVADDPPEHRLHSRDHVVEVERARMQHLAAAEGEQLAGEAADACSAAWAISRSASRSPHLLLEQRGVAGDHRQQVVEVVRDAAGEAPDRLHLLRLLEPVLEPEPVGDVVGEHERRLAAVVDDRPGRDLDVDDRAVLAPVVPGRGAVRARAVLGQAPEQRLHVLARADLRDRHREELVAGVAVVADRGVVDGEEAQRVGVVDPHRQRARLEQHL